MVRKSRPVTFLTVLALALFTSSFAHGQSAAIDPAEWIRIVSPSGELSIDVLEKDMLVDIEGRSHRISSFRNDFSIQVFMTKNSDAKSGFREENRFLPDPGRYKVFESGDFLIREAIDSLGPKPSAGLSLASSGWSYFISVSARETTRAEFANVLNSIQIRGISMFKAGLSAMPAKRVTIDSLELSPLVREALARADSEQVDLPRANIDDPPKTDDTIYSRPLLMIRRPRAAYTNAARSSNIQGTVKLRIPLLATGRLGQIGVISSVDRGLEENALKAAKKIKFITAQIGGKSVDVVRTIEYTFSLF